MNKIVIVCSCGYIHRAGFFPLTGGRCSADWPRDLILPKEILFFLHFTEQSFQCLFPLQGNLSPYKCHVFLFLQRNSRVKGLNESCRAGVTSCALAHLGESIRQRCCSSRAHCRWRGTCVRSPGTVTGGVGSEAPPGLRVHMWSTRQPRPSQKGLRQQRCLLHKPTYILIAHERGVFKTLDTT